ncbi:hypothetical protein M0638_25880 [Roseomonas sp. NAR14]|uniref:DUF4347 domain-containing protein n=1 Tax=Roseomonas acroporae TaxID=2937791 RepID=A0A9X1YET3_9PROT|nr:hypothetical protein [Roseomonas acroporae]MCK8787790.1 hypothetical protein [Roseomonas acroporae]
MASERRVDVYLADEWMWIGTVNGRAGAALPLSPPVRRQGMEAPIVPFIAIGQSWADTIGKVVGALGREQAIEKLFIAGHGAGGEVTVGTRLRAGDDAAIGQFRRLRPFVRSWLTHAAIIGCEVAADGPAGPGTVPVQEGGKVRQVPVAFKGQFSGDTSKPGYTLLRKLADALEAPVSGSPWRLAIADGWTLGGAKLTVGPGGGWVYSAIDAPATRFGSP